MSNLRHSQEIRKLSEVNLRGLRWARSGKLESQLISEGQLVGTLRWASGRSSLATAESADGAWTFKRAGFLRPRITIREPGSDSDLAVMPMSWIVEGILRFYDGRSFLIRCSSLWRSEVTVFDSRGKNLMALKPDSRAGGERGLILIERTALDEIPGLSLLAIFGVYMALLIVREDAYRATMAALVAAGAI
jgi:hypothetical protein